MNTKEKLKNIELQDCFEKEVDSERFWNKYCIFVIGIGAVSVDDASEINEMLYKKYNENENVNLSMIARTGPMPDFVPWDFVRSEVVKRTQKDEISIVDFTDDLINVLGVDAEDAMTCVKVFNRDGEELAALYDQSMEEISAAIEKIVEE